MAKTSDATATAETFVAKDGSTRKAYYGNGKQPWDYMVEAGWAAHYAAGCVVKYLRRKKGEDVADKEKARWYWGELNKLAMMPELKGKLAQVDAMAIRRAKQALDTLKELLTRAELKELSA